MKDNEIIKFLLSNIESISNEVRGLVLLYWEKLQAWLAEAHQKIDQLEKEYEMNQLNSV